MSDMNLLLVVVAAWAVDVAVGEFFCARLPHFDDLAFEVQGDAREGGIGVNVDDIVADCGDDNCDGSVVSFGPEGHSRLQLIVTELLSRDFRDQRLVTQAVPLSRLDSDRKLSARVHPLKVCLKAWHKIVVPMQVSHRSAVFRAVNQLAVIVGQFVFEQDNFIFSDHVVLIFSEG
jgi:hypothetical protein